MKIKNYGLKVLGITLALCSFCFTVKATTVSVDNNNKINMPYYLYVNADNFIEFNGLDGSSNVYQIVEVTNNLELVNKIDSIDEEVRTLAGLEEDLKNYTSGTNEYTNQLSVIEYAKENINNEIKGTNFKTLVPDYNDANWLALNTNVIPTATLEENHYYIIWIKSATGTSQPVYQYHPYKAVKTGNYAVENETKTEEIENPETGIETTLLYVGAIIAIAGGSYLVFKKNQESY